MLSVIGQNYCFLWVEYSVDPCFIQQEPVLQKALQLYDVVMLYPYQLMSYELVAEMHMSEIPWHQWTLVVGQCGRLFELKWGDWTHEMCIGNFILHIEADWKWLPFYIRHFQIDFLIAHGSCHWNLFACGAVDNNTAPVQILAWCLRRDWLWTNEGQVHRHMYVTGLFNSLLGEYFCWELNAAFLYMRIIFV